MMGIDGRLSLYLSTFSQFPFIKNLGICLNRLGQGDALAFICILLILYGYLRGRARELKAGLAGIPLLLSCGILVQALKRLLGRARPQMNLGDFHFIGPNFIPNGFDSFPSGHSAASFTLAAYL